MAKTRRKMKIKKGDLVQVISGRSQKNGGDRGKQGKVIAVYPETQRVLVEGINRVTKHVKAGATARGTRTGGLDPHRGRDPREQRGDRRPRVEEADADQDPRRDRGAGRSQKAARVRVAVKSDKDL